LIDRRRNREKEWSLDELRSGETSFEHVLPAEEPMNKLLCVFSACLVLACSAMADDLGSMIFNHRIAIGMTFGNVQAAWGRPLKVDRSVYGDTVREYWFFNNGSLVVFENGRVASFHQ
jgi:hypothetical protein